MIQVEIIRDASKAYVGFSIKGHAGYAEHGQDIICAAVSVLAQNTVNSIEQFIQFHQRNGKRGWYHHFSPQ